MNLPQKMKIHAYPPFGALDICILECRGALFSPISRNGDTDKRKIKKAFNRWHKMQHYYKWVGYKPDKLAPHEAYKRPQ